MRSNSNVELRAAIQLGDRRGGGDDQLHCAIVELVDQRDEAARGVLGVRPERGHVGQEHRVIAARDLDVVGLAARAVAQLLELEPDHAVGVAVRAQAAMVEDQRRIGRAGLGGNRIE